MALFHFGLRGNYPTTHPPTPKVVKRCLYNNLDPYGLWENVGNHIDELAEDMVWEFRAMEFEFDPSLSWVKEIIRVNSFASHTRQEAVNSLTFKNLDAENTRSYFFYGIYSLLEDFSEPLFAVAEFYCETIDIPAIQIERPIDMNESDSDSEHILFEIDL